MKFKEGDRVKVVYTIPENDVCKLGDEGEIVHTDEGDQYDYKVLFDGRTDDEWMKSDQLASVNTPKSNLPSIVEEITKDNIQIGDVVKSKDESLTLLVVGRVAEAKANDKNLLHTIKIHGTPNRSNIGNEVQWTILDLSSRYYRLYNIINIHTTL